MPPCWIYDQNYFICSPTARISSRSSSSFSLTPPERRWRARGVRRPPSRSAAAPGAPLQRPRHTRLLGFLLLGARSSGPKSEENGTKHSLSFPTSCRELVRYFALVPHWLAGGSGGCFFYEHLYCWIEPAVWH